MTTPPDSIHLEFLALWLADRETGRARTRAEYEALFPGHEAQVAVEWAAAHTPSPAPPPAAHATEGHVAGFKLLRELGRGGQARVWLAEDVRLGRRVALKLVPRSPFTDDLAPRLRREARAASRLDHPGLCAVYDAGVDGAVAWIALRHVEGETLAARITAERAQERARAPVDEVLALGEALARALHVAHQAGVVHRDVKPANVMLGTDGAPVLLDFGVALESAGDVPLTLTGDTLGTPAYMAPEQLAGRRADPRSDVWSLGVTLFEALTLERPFAAPSTAAEARAISELPAPDARGRRKDLSRDAAVVLATALAKRPEDRYATAADLAEDLRRARLREPVLARPLGPFARAARWCERAPGLAASLGALALALVVGAVTSSVSWLRARDALRESRALLGDVEHLADSLDARRLVEGLDGLWPARSARQEAFDGWLADATRLGVRRDTYVAVLGAARARIAAGAARATDAWLADGLGELLERLAAVEALAPRVAEAQRFAASVSQRTIVDAADAWARAAREVAADPRFAGATATSTLTADGRFTLAPIEGLLPLGADPASGLQEFAHLASGAPAVRDAATGALTVSGETGVVLVLVPGGRTAVGVHGVDDAHPPGAPFVDELAWRWDGPHLPVRLDPFLIAKHELTQGQWFRHTHERPSAYGAGSGYVTDADLHPVEEVSWDECTQVLAALDLVLPSEAQWDHAARGGTTTAWWTGPMRESLQGAANVADRTSRALGGAHAWQWEATLDDPFVVHAPVDTLRANPFGLHHVAGNVAEWCADGYEDWSAVPPRDGDGRALGTEPLRVFRGGHFTSDAVRARSGARDGHAANVRASYIGARAARSAFATPRPTSDHEGGGS